MDQDPVRRERLGDPIATVVLNDCQLTFRRQLGSNDVWCVATGPLGAVALPLIEDAALRRVRAGRAARGASRDESSRQKFRGRHQVQIDDDFVVAVRADGNRLSYGYLFGDGAAFGGGGSGLPTLRRLNLLARARLRLSGARGVRFTCTVTSSRNPRVPPVDRALRQVVQRFGVPQRS
jgi:hypothetical protein